MDKGADGSMKDYECRAATNERELIKILDDPDVQKKIVEIVARAIDDQQNRTAKALRKLISPS